MAWQDTSDAAARERAFRSGAGPTAAVVVFFELYVALTWGSPHRSTLLAVGALAGAAALAIFAAPLGRVLRGPWCQPFFVAFSGSLVVLATVSAALDGGMRSPLTALLFLPLAFAAVSYPLGAVLGVAGVDLVSFTALVLATPNARVADALMLAGTLATTAWMCVSQARRHDAQRRELARASRTDPLTGCLNRRGFEERLHGALEQARRDGAELALVVVDLDNFKAVNDAEGHAAGDETLRWVAERMRASLRAGDTVGRLGGDEFAVLLSDGANAEAAMGRIASALSERAPASLGLAAYPGDGWTAEQLHRAADAALYASKRGERATARAVRRAA